MRSLFAADGYVGGQCSKPARIEQSERRVYHNALALQAFQCRAPAAQIAKTSDTAGGLRYAELKTVGRACNGFPIAT